MSEKLIQTSFDELEVKCSYGHLIRIPIFRSQTHLGDGTRIIDVKDETQRLLMSVLKDQDENIKRIHQNITPILDQTKFLQKKITLLEKCLFDMGSSGTNTIEFVNKVMKDYKP